MAMNRNFPRKIHWQSKNINFVIGTPNQACMQNLSQIGESTGPTLVRHKRNVIMHILHTGADKKILFTDQKLLFW